MKSLLVNKRWFLLILMAFVLLGAAGCSTTTPENYSERPWNTPRSWETGLPSSLTEGR